MKIAVIILFLLTYILIIVFQKYKVYLTGASAIIISVLLLTSKEQSFLDILNSIDFNVILMLFGIMLTVYFFSESGMPNLIAEKMVSKVHSTVLSAVLLCLLSGIISAFLDNVATVLMLAPIALAVCKKVNISPIPVIIGIAVSSNLQGAATLVGDTTSVMLGSFANMSFADFFFLNGKPSIFFAVELGALFTLPILYFMLRKENKRFEYIGEKVKVTSIFPTLSLCITLLLLIAFSFVKDKLDITNGIICISVGIVTFIYGLLSSKRSFIKTIKCAIDFSTIFFLIFLFILIGAIICVGVIDDISKIFINLGDENIFLIFIIIVFGSVIFSAFIDNIPFIATMLPVVSAISEGLISSGASSNVSYLLYFGLLCGATLGGNLTPIGASANVVGIGILNKGGYNAKTRDFLKIGVPFTLTAVITGCAFIYLFWGI